MAGEPEVKAFKMVCPQCGSGQFSISEAGVVGRPRGWGPEVLSMADCRGCQKVFLVKLPQELAWTLYRHISRHISSGLPAEAIIPLRTALGLR